jgi:hypothetical protein
VQTASIDGANGIALHPEGGIVVSASAPYSSRVVYINASGQIVWHRELDGAGINDITTDAAGNTYLVATAQRRFNYGINSIVGPALGEISAGGASDGALIKLNPAGEPVWGKLFTYVRSDQPGTIPVFSTDPTGVVVDEARGAIYVCGTIQANAYFGLVGWVRRFDLSGTEQWNRFTNTNGLGSEPVVIGDSFSRPLGNLALSIALGNAGEVYVGGGAGQSDSPQRPFVVRVSPEGVQEWRRDLDVEGGAVAAVSFRRAQNDVVALVNVGNHLIHDNYQSGTLINLSASGAPGWRKTLTTTVSAQNPTTTISPRSLTADPTGMLFAVGDTSGNYANQTNAGGPAGTFGLDLFVARINANGE